LIIKFMNKRYVLAALLLLLPACLLRAQDTDFNTRTSAAIDWKLRKGLHLNAEYELRTQDDLAGVERHQATVGLEYKINSWLKAGADYIYIGHYNSDDTFKPRHRFSANLIGTFDAGDWRFSLREKLQLTHYAYSVNTFQQPKNALQLKSRFNVKYRGFDRVEPFAYIEVRNIFNAPRCSATYSTASEAWTDYEFLSYDYAYVNRVRYAVGLDWKLSKRHALTFTEMLSNCRDWEIDTNKAGTKLKSMGWDKSRKATLCVGYTFSF
jgi:hypothetical protein